MTANRPKRSAQICAYFSGGPLGDWRIWSHPPGSNRRPADYESAALPTELGWLSSFDFISRSHAHQLPRAAARPLDRARYRWAPPNYPGAVSQTYLMYAP